MIFFMLNRRAHPGLFGFSPPFFNPVFLSCLIAQYFPDLVFDLSKRNIAAVGKLRVLLCKTAEHVGYGLVSDLYALIISITLLMTWFNLSFLMLPA